MCFQVMFGSYVDDANSHVVRTVWPAEAKASSAMALRRTRGTVSNVEWQITDEVGDGNTVISEVR